MDKVFVEELTLQTIIGIFEWEQKQKQRVVLDMEIAVDIRKAVLSDDIEDTLNYAAICERLEQFADEHQFKLLEGFAEAIADIIQREFGASWLKLKIRKPDVLPLTKNVGLIIERGPRQATQ